jgi:DNA helicase-2/ATP-dependent DNA helicase PcrA
LAIAWELIKYYPVDIKEWLKVNLVEEITELNEQQAKSRGANKTTIDREKKIASKTKRLNGLDSIVQFVYNPNGDNLTKSSLNHSEVISIASSFLLEKPLLQKILIRKFPILLIDESQDTKKELIDALFSVQANHSQSFSLGLFGDTMQRIYNDGKENLGQSLPVDWLKPVKKMNHRCPKRVIKLINKIRSAVDNQEQLPRVDKEDGFTHFFIVQNNVANKPKIEANISKRMAEITKDELWTDSILNVQTLTLEHHMAAKRMGFLELYEPLYKVERFRTGLLDGTLSGIRFFTQRYIVTTPTSIVF